MKWKETLISSRGSKKPKTDEQVILKAKADADPVEEDLSDPQYAERCKMVI